MLLNALYIKEAYNNFNVVFEGKTDLPVVHFLSFSFFHFIEILDNKSLH